MKIDIPSVLVHLRGRVVREEKKRTDPEQLAMDAVGQGVLVAAALRAGAAARRSSAAARSARLPVPGWSAMRDLPEVPEQTFREWWRERAR